MLNVPLLCPCSEVYEVSMMQLPKSAAFAVLVAGLALGACSEDVAEIDDTALAGDPAIVGALGDHIMVDPDLSTQNESNSALSTSARSGALPAEARSPQAVSAAREEAQRLLRDRGGINSPPAATPEEGEASSVSLLTVTARAAALAGESECADRATYTMQWAAKMPTNFPIYPRGSVQEAAGSDTAGCALRVVNFITPVPVGDVMEFYYSLSDNNGFDVERTKRGDEDRLTGKKGSTSFTVALRVLPWGGTEVDLITSGK